MRSLEDAAREIEKQKKPRENKCFPELSSVGLTRFELATSTPPVTGERLILRQKPWSTQHTVGCNSTV